MASSTKRPKKLKVLKPSKQKISGSEKVAECQLRKRKIFEDNIRKNRSSIGNWLKYARWEESQKQINRARSVYNRALTVEHRNVTLWLKYAEMELKHRKFDHAMNILDYAITIFPQVNQFWYKYINMEEMLNEVTYVREIFERWIKSNPIEQAWLNYIKFELRLKNIEGARQIYDRFVKAYPQGKNWIKYAKFEESNGFISRARSVYERAVECYGHENLDEKLVSAFAKFEVNQPEHNRAMVIYKLAIDRISKEDAEFFKKYGDRAGIENFIVSRRKYQYEEEIKANPLNYDTWLNYLHLVESEGNIAATRELYERAIANVPSIKVKSFWRRYIYLWINYALFEELQAKEGKEREVYNACLKLIPHKTFTFAKIWLLAAQYEIRNKNLLAARKGLCTAIKMYPKAKLFKGYIELEIQLREFDRCRIWYQKFLEFDSKNCFTWMKFARLETFLGDFERARAIYKIAINQPRLDMPHILWKAYLGFEINQEQFDLVRQIYETLVERTQHFEPWIRFAQFELGYNEEKIAIAKSRQIYERGNKSLRKTNKKEYCAMLLEAWKEFEDDIGDEKCKQNVEKLMPRKVKKRRKVETDDGAESYEEYYDYIFPDDEVAKPHLKLLRSGKKRIHESGLMEES